MSANLPPHELPPELGSLMRASASLLSLVVTFILYAVGSDELDPETRLPRGLDGGVVVGFITAAHGAVWHLVGEVWRLRRRRLGRGAAALLLVGTLGGLGGALGMGTGCGHLEARLSAEDVPGCFVEAARAAAVVAAGISSGQDAATLATLVAAELAALHRACVSWDDAPALVPVVVPVPDD